MTDVVTDAVSMQVWRVRRRDVPAALLASRVTARTLRRRRDVDFAKMLGTATDDFLPTTATLRRWVALVCLKNPTPIPEPWWERHAVEHASLTLRPLSSRGRWDGRDPFVVRRSDHWSGPVVVLTRSTLRLRAARRFYRAVPPIAAELRQASGCRVAFGIGEAPVVRQGTVSIWDSAEAVKAFAYRSPHHVAAITATPEQNWYAEELFTRFALLDGTGTIDGAAVA